jgi:tRNA threonylcarbamoyladenosine biosynthesis protein TsaB
LTFALPGTTTALMVVLALDTTTRTGSVAVVRDGHVLTERSGDPEIPHGRRLPGDAIAALSAAGLALADVNLYAVASGPGSFTGLRIGIATVQGLAFAHQRQVVAISALDALANVVLESGRRGSSHVGPGPCAPAGAGREAPPPQPEMSRPKSALVGVWMDAARGEVFSALYESGATDQSEPLEREGPSVGSPDATLTRWDGWLRGRSVIFVGEGAARYADRIDAALGDRAVVVAETPPIAATIGRLALRRVGTAGPPHAVRPLYVRRPDAELAREQRALSGKARG